MSIPSATRIRPNALPGSPSLLGSGNDIVPFRRGGGVAPGLPETPRTAPPRAPSPGLPGSNDIVPYRRPLVPGDIEPPRLPNRAPVPRPGLPGSAVGGAGRGELGRLLRSRGAGAAARTAGRGVGRLAGRAVPYVGWALTAYELASFGYGLYRNFQEPDTYGMPAGDGSGLTGQGLPFGQSATLYEISYEMGVYNVITGVKEGESTRYFETLVGPFAAPKVVFTRPSDFPTPGRDQRYQWQIETLSGIYTLNMLGSGERDGSPNYTLPYQLQNFRVRRLDGQPEPTPWLPEPLPGISPYPSTSPSPNPLPSPAPGTSPAPYPSPIPNTSPSPLPGLSPFPVPNPAPIPGTTPIPGTAPYPVPLPIPSPFPVPVPFPFPSPSPPTPGLECCPAIMIELGRLTDNIPEIEASGYGVMDLAPCASEIDPENPPDPLEGAYEGSGLDGIYAAIAQITKSLNLIRADTKCPPDGNAALPMHFETRAGTVPQLVVSWRSVEGGQSKWSFCIPHPKPIINHNTVFSFPTYTKGNTQLTYTLLNNSKVILNAISEAEGLRILTYVKTLIDPAYINPLATPKITKGAGQGQLREVLVKATYIQKFQGHLSEVALWAKSL